MAIKWISSKTGRVRCWIGRNYTWTITPEPVFGYQLSRDLKPWRVARTVKECKRMAMILDAIVE